VDEDLRPYIADKTLTSPDIDMADFTATAMDVSPAPTAS